MHLRDVIIQLSAFSEFLIVTTSFLSHLGSRLLSLDSKSLLNQVVSHLPYLNKFSSPFNSPHRVCSYGSFLFILNITPERLS